MNFKLWLLLFLAFPLIISLQLDDSLDDSLDDLLDDSLEGREVVFEKWKQKLTWLKLSNEGEDIFSPLNEHNFDQELEVESILERAWWKDEGEKFKMIKTLFIKLEHRPLSPLSPLVQSIQSPASSEPQSECLLGIWITIDLSGFEGERKPLYLIPDSIATPLTHFLLLFLQPHSQIHLQYCSWIQDPLEMNNAHIWCQWFMNQCPSFRPSLNLSPPPDLSMPLNSIISFYSSPLDDPGMDQMVGSKVMMNLTRNSIGSNTGMHLMIETEIEWIQLQTEVDIEKRLIIIETLPSDLFVDSYVKDNDVHIGSFRGEEFIFWDKVNIEQSSDLASQQLILISKRLKATDCEVEGFGRICKIRYKLPIHLRYQPVEVDDRYKTIEIMDPIVWIAQLPQLRDRIGVESGAKFPITLLSKLLVNSMVREEEAKVYGYEKLVKMKNEGKERMIVRWPRGDKEQENMVKKMTWIIVSLGVIGTIISIRRKCIIRGEKNKDE